MDKIYLDHACTSWPKPAEVIAAVTDYMTRIGSNVSRSSYSRAYEAEEIVFNARALICELFHGPDVKNVIFTKNITESLNVLIKGLLRPGDHVLVSSMEHNAVMRPLNQIARELCAGEKPPSEDAITYTRIPCDRQGFLQSARMEELLLPSTRALIMTTASNVSGTLMPVKEAGEFCKRKGLVFLTDTAQTAGVYDIDMEECGIDALAFTGHKGLLGPQGIGGFIIGDALAAQIEPLLSGGTGSFSHTEEVPVILPDRFEAGTMNLPGIAGLAAGIHFLKDRGLGAILAHEKQMTQLFLNGIRPLERGGYLRIAGPDDAESRAAVVSVSPSFSDPSDIAYLLDAEFGILTRVGLHCAPSAHKSLGTFPGGTIRFSFGPATTGKEIEAAVRALDELIRCRTKQER